MVVCFHTEEMVRFLVQNEPIGFCNAQCSEDASSGHMVRISTPWFCGAVCVSLLCFLTLRDFKGAGLFVARVAYCSILR